MKINYSSYRSRCKEVTSVAEGCSVAAGTSVDPRSSCFLASSAGSSVFDSLAVGGPLDPRSDCAGNAAAVADCRSARSEHTAASCPAAGSCCSCY